jgi:hypothetical protein
MPIDAEPNPDPSVLAPPRTEYLRLFQEYIAALGWDDRLATVRRDWARMENHILRNMIDIGMFDSIHGALVGFRRVQITNTYDYTNLSHRFLVQYVHAYELPVHDAEILFGHRPIPSNCHSVPMVNYHPHNLNLFVAAPDTQHPEQIPRPIVDQSHLRSNGISNPMEFAVNGQKFNIVLNPLIDYEGRSRYTIAINLRLSSLRNTNVKNVAQLTIFNKKIYFSRTPVTRPSYGIKFVRRNDGKLVIKEIDK